MIKEQCYFILLNVFSSWLLNISNTIALSLVLTLHCSLKGSSGTLACLCYALDYFLLLTLAGWLLCMNLDTRT
jgi:hypothetical protein